MRGCLGAAVIAGAAALTSIEATATEALLREFWDPVFTGYPYIGDENFQMRVSAKSFFDYGGGYVTGLGMHAVDPALTGYSYHTGYLSSQFEPITFNGGLGVIKFVGQTNIGYIDVDNGNPLSDNSHFATMPSKFFGVALGNLVDDSHELRFGANLTGEYSRNRTELKGDNRDNAGCDEDDLDRDFCITNANVYVSTAWGKFTAGRVESASAWVGAINTGGITHVTNNDPIYNVGFHDVLMIGIPFAEIAPDITGKTRTDGVRYDSPTIAGFTLSSSWGEDQNDVALRYAGEFGAIRIAGGASYQNSERDDTDDTQQNVNVAASLYHTPTGLYITGSASFVERDSDAPPAMGETSSATSYYVQAGIRTQWIEWGDTTVYTEYNTSDGGGNSGAYFVEDSGTESYGLGIVQDIDALGASLYLKYNNHSADRAGIEGDDIDVVMIGARIKF